MQQARVPGDIAIAHPDCLFIGGRWVSSQASGWIEVVSPDSEAVVAVVAEGREADMDAAAAAARQAFDHGPWPRLSPRERGALLAKMGDYLAGRAGELAAAWTAQVGTLAVAAPFMTGVGIGHFHRAAALSKTFVFDAPAPSEVAVHARVLRDPVGVVAAIAPWNAPFGILAGKTAHALLAGCTVVMKPAPETPLEAYIVAEAAEAVGLPPGVVNLVCAHRAASAHLVRDRRVDKVSFTGSTSAGRTIAVACAERFARCTLELGGKSAAFVLDDFDIGEAAKILAATITISAGQVCTMLSRAIVTRTRHDQLAEAIAAEMARIRVGHSHDPTSQMGPVAMKRQLERVEGFIAQGKASDATLVCGGARPKHLNRGYFIEPTLFANVDNASVIAQEEIFGPVLSLIPCDDEADAVRIANDSAYGLSGAVFTHDVDAAYRIGRAVRTGNVGQNGMRGDFALPFGGFKQSGIGREGGPEGLMAYLETKVLLLDGAPRR